MTTDDLESRLILTLIRSRPDGCSRQSIGDSFPGMAPADADAAIDALTRSNLIEFAWRHYARPRRDPELLHFPVLRRHAATRP